jgi:uncharacterized protein YbjT (DUF2867 family)
MQDIACNIPRGTRVLITGATGFTGTALTKKLVEQGLDVVAIARHSSNLKPLENLKVEWVRGDVFDPEIVRQAVDRAEYIFVNVHRGSIVKFTPASPGWAFDL